MSTKKKATPVTITIPASRTAPVIRAMDAASAATDTAISELEKLDREYPEMQAKVMAGILVKAGAKWSENTIMQELSRIRALKKAGKWQDGMTSYQAREAHKALPKGTRAKKAEAEPVSPTSVISGESGEKLVQKISRTAPDTIANALVEALIQSGLDDLEKVLAEARRLVVQAVNAKKQPAKK